MTPARSACRASPAGRLSRARPSPAGSRCGLLCPRHALRLLRRVCRVPLLTQPTSAPPRALQLPQAADAGSDVLSSGRSLEAPRRHLDPVHAHRSAGDPGRRARRPREPGRGPARGGGAVSRGGRPAPFPPAGRGRQPPQHSGRRARRHPQTAAVAPRPSTRSSGVDLRGVRGPSRPISTAASRTSSTPPWPPPAVPAPLGRGASARPPPVPRRAERVPARAGPSR